MKNMMKKLTALLLVLLMCFTLCACSSEKAEEGTTAGNTTTLDVSIYLPSIFWSSISRGIVIAERQGEHGTAPE